ncbi:MAG: helix-turn-helix transcriptional regulator [Acidimicrobiales bacterium]
MEQEDGEPRAAAAGLSRGGARRQPATPLQRRARAPGDPTRFAIFDFVRAAGSPVGVAALTERFGLNHNAVRQHLAKLVEAGLIRELTAEPHGPGRPKLCYLAGPEAEEALGGEGPYLRLSLLLADVIATGRSPREVGALAGERLAARRQQAGPVPVGRAPRRAGPQRGAEPGGELGEAASRALQVIETEMEALGFRPRAGAPTGTGARGGARRVAVTLSLERCPFEEAAVAQGKVVCDLHRGIAEGIAGSVGGELRIDGLRPTDPRRAGCRLSMSGPRQVPSATREVASGAGLDRAAG